MTEPYWKASIAKAIATRIANQRARAQTRVRIEDDVAYVEVTGSDKPMVVSATDAELVGRHSWLIESGYARASINGRMVRAHRLIMDAQPGQQLDHINGERLDNRRINLRFVTAAGNARNQGLYRNNTSGLIGVCSLPNGRYRAEVRWNSRTVYHETFTTAIQAAHARDEVAAAYFGEHFRSSVLDLFARLDVAARAHFANPDDPAALSEFDRIRELFDGHDPNVTASRFYRRTYIGNVHPRDAEAS